MSQSSDVIDLTDDDPADAGDLQTGFITSEDHSRKRHRDTRDGDNDRNRGIIELDQQLGIDMAPGEVNLVGGESRSRGSEVFIFDDEIETDNSKHSSSDIKGSNSNNNSSSSSSSSSSNKTSSSRPIVIREFVPNLSVSLQNRPRDQRPDNPAPHPPSGISSVSGYGQYGAEVGAPAQLRMVPPTVAGRGGDLRSINVSQGGIIDGRFVPAAPSYLPFAPHLHLNMNMNMNMMLGSSADGGPAYSGRMLPQTIMRSGSGLINNNNNIFNNNNMGYRIGPGLMNTSYQSALSRCVVVFKLLNYNEFSARVEQGIPNIQVSMKMFDRLIGIKGNRFDKALNSWVFPIISHNALKSFFHSLESEGVVLECLPNYILACSSIHNGLDIGDDITCSKEIYEEVFSKIPKQLFNKLAPFQVKAVKFGLHNKGRILLADEMGLGKTRSAIGIASAYQSEFPVLIICPSSAKYHWKNEILHCFDCDLEGGQSRADNVMQENSSSNDNDDDNNSRSNNSSNRNSCSTSDSGSNNGHAEASQLKGVGPLIIKPDDICIVERDNQPLIEISKQVDRLFIMKEDSSSISTKRNYIYNYNNGFSDGDNDDLKRIDQRIESEINKKTKIIIISYDYIRKAVACLHRMGINIVICDESHYLKNSKTVRAQKILPLLKASKRLVLISGTPALSRPLELYTQLKAIDENMFRDYAFFKRRYCSHSSSNSVTPGGSKCVNVFGGNNSGNKRGSRNGGEGDGNDNSDEESRGDIDGSNTIELNLLLTKTVMIRRLKKDILKGLPPKIRTIVKIDIVNEEKRRFLSELLGEIRKKSDKIDRIATKDLTADMNDRNTSNNSDEVGGDVKSLIVERKSLLMQCFRESSTAKLDAIIPYIDRFLADVMSGKLLIFAHHKSVLDGIEAHLIRKYDTINAGNSGRKFEKSNNDESGINKDNSSKHDDGSFKIKSPAGYIRIDGRVDSQTRSGLVARFQSKSWVRVALLSITAANISLTLTAASTVYFAELFWTPGSLIQAEDRAHRIGQTSAVDIKYFLADGSIDEFLWPLLQKKSRLLGEVVEGVDGGYIAVNSLVKDDSRTHFIEKVSDSVSVDSLKSSQSRIDDVNFNVNDGQGNATNDCDPYTIGSETIVISGTQNDAVDDYGRRRESRNENGFGDVESQVEDDEGKGEGCGNAEVDEVEEGVDEEALIDNLVSPGEDLITRDSSTEVTSNDRLQGDSSDVNRTIQKSVNEPDILAKIYNQKLLEYNEAARRRLSTSNSKDIIEIDADVPPVVTRQSTTRVIETVDLLLDS